MVKSILSEFLSVDTLPSINHLRDGIFVYDYRIPDVHTDVYFRTLKKQIDLSIKWLFLHSSC